MTRTLLLSWPLAIAAIAVGAAGMPRAPSASATPTRALAAPAPAKAPPVPAPENLVAVTALAGEDLAALLLRSGVGGLDSALAASAAAVDPLEEGQRVRLQLGTRLPGGARSLEALELRLAPRSWLIVRPSAEGFAATPETRDIDETPLRLRLAPGPELAARLADHGLPPSLRFEIVRLVGDSPVGAVEAIVAREQSAAGVTLGPLLLLSLASTGAAPRRWLGQPGGTLVELAERPSSAALERPVAGPVTSSPGLRFHPLLRVLRWHRGTDFAAPHGTPVKAAADGEVIAAGWGGGYGRLVRLRHSDGSVTTYAHLSRIAVPEGARVARGSLLGQVGATGLATGPHLHFELTRVGQTVRPDFHAHGHAETLGTKEPETLGALLASPYHEPRRPAPSAS